MKATQNVEKKKKKGVGREIEWKGARQRHNSHLISIKNKEVVRREMRGCSLSYSPPFVSYN